LFGHELRSNELHYKNIYAHQRRRPVVDTRSMEQSLSGKTVVVTGATSGIGLATADLLASQGAYVIGVGRSVERCQQVERRLATAHPGGSVAYCVADLSLQSQVRELASQIRGKVNSNGATSLDGLVNNAGTFTYRLTLTAEGFEMQWAVNHLGAFLLTHELLPLLQAAPLARVVTVSSMSHYLGRMHWDDIQLRRRYNGLRAYRQTKLANVLFTLELNRRMGAQSNLRAFAADPGLVNTDIGAKGNPGFVGRIWKWRAASGVSPEESARGLAYLVSEPSIQDAPEIYWKHGAPKTPGKHALDGVSARRLWALSEQMCGIRG
jgi:NAD(P)-dependent dehydrogenase (short-subunit alcohol dehydrogenase family)